MKHGQQVKILKELMGQLDSGKTIDSGMQYRASTDVYVSPEIADQEWFTFFKNHPQLIGLTGDLPEKGSYFTTDDFGVPVLATRDNDGEFRAFLNACRHRGVQVTNDTRGRAGRFTCPFHAWTYSNKGDLVALPQEDHFGEIDKSCNGLVSLPCIEHNGMLWVHPQPDGVLDIESLLGGLVDELSTFDFEGLDYSGETVIDMELNWKLANDTFGETYHFQKLHKNTLGQVFYGENLSYEEFGRNHRFCFASKAIDLLRGKPESEWNILGSTALLYYLFPNVQFSVGNGTASVIRIYPDKNNPGRSITKVSHYFSKELIEQAEQAAADTADTVKVTSDNVYEHKGESQAFLSMEALMEIFDSTIEKEDYLMGEQTQKSAESGILEHVIFGRNEPALHHFHNTFAEALNRKPLERIS